MSPQRNTLSDRESESSRTPGRPSAPRAAILDAACAVFESADTPEAVTMEALATAAGVGKGTIFRAFGDRDGLLDAAVESRFSALRATVREDHGPFGADVAAHRRIDRFLDALLDFKLANRNLMRARELASGTTNLASERYRWMHDTLVRWIEEAGSATTMTPSFAAHALLLPLQIDVIERLIADGLDVPDLKRQQTSFRAALLASARHP